MKKAVYHLSLDVKHLDRVLLVRLCKPVADPETGEAEGVPEEGYWEEERSGNDCPVHHCCLRGSEATKECAAAGSLCASLKLGTACRDDLLSLSVHTQLAHAPSFIIKNPVFVIVKIRTFGDI